MDDGVSLGRDIMKIERVLLELFGLLAAVAAGWAQAPDQPKLSGIFYWENDAQALLEWRSGKGAARKAILGHGESVDGFEVKRIDEKAGTVELLPHSENKKVMLDLGLPPEEQLAQRTFHFRSADLEQVFEVYQEVSKKTVIRSGNLKTSKIDLKTGANLSPEDGMATLNRTIAAAGIKMKPIGTKFVFALAEGDEQRIRSLSEPPMMNASDEKFPPGLIKFTAADPVQVLEVYSELTGRPRVARDLRQGAKVTVRSQTELTRREAAWLLEAALLLGGVSISPEAAKPN